MKIDSKYNINMYFFKLWVFKAERDLSDFYSTKCHISQMKLISQRQDDCQCNLA